MKTLRILTDTYPPVPNSIYWADVGYEILTRFLELEKNIICGECVWEQYEIWALSTRGGHAGGFLSKASRWYPLQKYFYHTEPCPKDFINIVIGPANLKYGWTLGVPNIAIYGDWSVKVIEPASTVMYPFSDEERELLKEDKFDVKFQTGLDKLDVAAIFEQLLGFLEE